MTGHVSLYRFGDRKKVLAQGSLDEKLTIASGTYDVIIRAGEKGYAWPGIKIEGNIEKPLQEGS